MAKQTKANVVLTSDELEAQLTRIKLLADANRYAILQSLHNGDKTVTELVAEFGDTDKKMSQPGMSNALTLLRMAQLVTFSREGKNNTYTLRKDTLASVAEFVAELAK